MRALLVLVVVVVLSSARVPAAEPEGEWSRPYAVWLPGCEPVDASGRRAVVSVRLVRDTGEDVVPVAGGTVSFYTEESLGARLLGTALSDEFGFANLPRPENADAGEHWHFEAPGAGVVHEFASFEGFDEGVCELPGGADRKIRVLDPFGAPLPAARVEVFLGCPHSPAARAGVTDADGVVSLSNMPPNWDWQFWVVAPGVRPGPYDLPMLRVGRGLRTLITEPGRSAAGIVLDEAGAPLAGVVVRLMGYDRGPLTRTDAEGRFTLVGIEGPEPIGFFVPGTPFADRAALLVSGFAEDVPLRIVLPSKRPATPAAGEPRFAVDLKATRAHPHRYENGDTGEVWLPEDGVPVTLTRLADGFTASGETGRMWRPDFEPGSLRLEVAAGTYRITAGGGFSRFAAVVSAADLPRPDGAPIEIRLTEEQPVLDIPPPPGDMAPSALHIAGRELWPLNGREVRLPAGAEAALLVRSDRWAEEDTLVPVSPAQEGRRTVAFTAPPENRIRFRIAVGEGVEAAPPVVYLENVAVTPVLLEDGSFEVSTSLAGRCRLEVDDVTIPVDLPADAPGLKNLGVIPGRDAVRVVRILRADGTPVTPEECGGVTPVFAPGEEESFVDTGPDGTVGIPPVPGEILLVVRPSDGFSLADLPFRVKLPARGPEVVKLPGGRISGDIRDPEGRAVPAVVYVDGYRFEAEEGRFDVGTVAAGPHVVIVGAEGRVGEARRILLADGESRSLSFDLPAR